MTNEVGIGEHIKRFFWLHSVFVRKYFNILIFAIELTWAPFLLISAGIKTIVTYIFSGPSAIIPGQKRV